MQKLLQQGQERDQFLAELRQKDEPEHVLELRQTIQIMQDKLDEREGEASEPLRLVIYSSADTWGPYI